MRKLMIKLFDTTLRDGSQAEGISFSPHDKLRVAMELDRLGVDYIEGGWPGSNPKDNQFFKEARKLKFKKRKLGRLRLDSPQRDPGVRRCQFKGASRLPERPSPASSENPGTCRSSMRCARHCEENLRDDPRFGPLSCNRRRWK